MRRIPKRTIWLFVIAGSLFIPAGTLAWPQGWLFLVEFIGGVVVTARWLKRRDPELYAERMKSWRRKEQPLWDKLFGLAMGIAWYAWIILMALEVKRWGISHMPLWLSLAGAAAMPLGNLLVAEALKANTFAATVVRLQPERGQQVIDTGPYAIVRHPIYTASLIVHVGTAMLLGSWIGLGLVPVLAGLLMMRVVLEEGLLRQGLPGYGDYLARVRWRLVPGVW